MIATIQFTMDFEPKNGVLNISDFLEDLDCTLMRKYMGGKFFKDQIQIYDGTKITRLIEDNKSGRAYIGD